MSDYSHQSATEDQEVDRDRLLDHEYDGIREYDNRLPNWWQYTLYGAIAFSIIYWLVFHIYHIVPLPRGRYQLEMAAAAELQLKKMEGQELTDKSLMLMSTIPDRTQRGRKIFEQFCVVCHGSQAEGNVGPNLTDDYWLHGNRPLQILNTVTHGVPSKGMAAWGGQLGPVRIQDVVSYVISIGGTKVPGKAPQGDLLGPPKAADEPAATATPTEGNPDARVTEPPGGNPDAPATAPAGDGSPEGTSPAVETAPPASDVGDGMADPDDTLRADLGDPDR